MFREEAKVRAMVASNSQGWWHADGDPFVAWPCVKCQGWVGRDQGLQWAHLATQIGPGHTRQGGKVKVVGGMQSVEGKGAGHRTG